MDFVRLAKLPQVIVINRQKRLSLSGVIADNEKNNREEMKMKTVEPEWSWIAHCPECHESVDQFDENVEEEGHGDDSVVTCEKCNTKFVVKVS